MRKIQKKSLGEKIWVKSIFPIARVFSHEDYDDFGASRKLWLQNAYIWGNDMMGQVGTPINVRWKAAAWRPLAGTSTAAGGWHPQLDKKVLLLRPSAENYPYLEVP